jgi:hypothetical protein
MILRRFTKHLKDQNWFVVELDVLAVITGIYLGLQVSDWNEERKYKDEAVTIITQLLTDAKTSHQFTHDQLERIIKRRANIELILSHDGNEKDVTGLRDCISNGLFGLFALSQLRSQYTTFEALK